LHGEYEARHSYWTKELPQSEIKQILLVESYKPAVAFYESASKEFFPALQQGNIKKASELLRGPLQADYEAHRKAIDKVVELTNRKNVSVENETKALLRNYNWLLAIIALLVCTACGATMFFIIRNVTRTFAYCAEIANRVASGDLSTHVPVAGKGSVRKMLESLNSMIENLHKVLGDIMTASAHIGTSAEQLSMASGQIAATAEEVTNRVEAAATAGEEMSATSAEIAQNCGVAAEGAQQTHDSAINGSAVVQETIQGMQRIAERVKDSAVTIENLGARSDQIGEIIGTIEDIADQTNLLALNAAIEAARAGEQGRGFAVVADEVRALAERTTKATKEIGSMIKSIQNETKNAVLSMEDGVRQVEQGTSEAERSGEALKEILSQINSVTMQVSQIATAAEQQTATTVEISSNMQQIICEVGGAARGAQESAGAANQLSLLAEDLQQMVGRFRLRE
jgi:methyl-accepting chemotaxis protein